MAGIGLRRPSTTPEPVALGCLAPARWHRWVEGSFAGSSHEGYAVDVDRHPVMVVHLEGESLLALHLKDHQGTAGTGHVDHSGPQPAAYPSVDVSDVDASGDLQQPFGEIAA